MQTRPHSLVAHRAPVQTLCPSLKPRLSALRSRSALVGYKAAMQTSIAFLHTSNKQVGLEIVTQYCTYEHLPENT